MMSDRVSMWVDPEFRRALKKKACDEGYSNMLDFTRDFSKELEIMPLELKKKNERFRLF
jgi:hypothetical protein